MIVIHIHIHVSVGECKIIYIVHVHFLGYIVYLQSCTAQFTLSIDLKDKIILFFLMINTSS